VDMDSLLFVGKEVKPIPFFPENSGAHTPLFYHLTLKVSQRLIHLAITTCITCAGNQFCLKPAAAIPRQAHAGVRQGLGFSIVSLSPPKGTSIFFQ
jgi:hypothetical protein